MPVSAGTQATELTPVPEHPSTSAAMTAMVAVTGGRKPLPPPAFGLCFPILAAVLSWPTHSVLHDPAMTVMGLHVGPQLQSPRGKMLQLLYHVLGLIPAFRYLPQTTLNSEKGIARALSGQFSERQNFALAAHI